MEIYRFSFYSWMGAQPQLSNNALILQVNKQLQQWGINKYFVYCLSLLEHCSRNPHNHLRRIHWGLRAELNFPPHFQHDWRLNVNRVSCLNASHECTRSCTDTESLDYGHFKIYSSPLASSSQLVLRNIKAHTLLWCFQFSHWKTLGNPSAEFKRTHPHSETKNKSTIGHGSTLWPSPL